MPASVSITQVPPGVAATMVYDVAGGSNIVYQGESLSSQSSPTTLTVSAVSKANPAAITSTAHGLLSDNLVTISGATGSWAALNGSRIITVTGANNFTVAVDSSGFSGSFDGSITTACPRTSAAVWAIMKNYYDVSSNLTRTAWAGGDTNMAHVWDNRASLDYR
jgi:hypothetical protein